LLSLFICQDSISFFLRLLILVLWLCYLPPLLGFWHLVRLFGFSLLIFLITMARFWIFVWIGWIDCFGMWFEKCECWTLCQICLCGDLSSDLSSDSIIWISKIIWKWHFVPDSEDWSALITFETKTRIFVAANASPFADRHSHDFRKNRHTLWIKLRALTRTSQSPSMLTGQSGQSSECVWLGMLTALFHQIPHRNLWLNQFHKSI
jgi:hypothetical protein